jgi:spore maturation protein CgeB
MKVLLAAPGHLRTVPMGGFVAAALRRLGHDVAVFDCAPRWQDKIGRTLGRGGGPAPAMNAGLRRIAATERPDLFLALFGFDIDEETAGAMRRLGVPTACWWLNDPFQLPRSLRQAGRYDFYFTNARGCLAEYRAAGIARAHFLPLAADPDVHRPLALGPEEMRRYESDVCFAGDWSPLREDWIRRLLPRCRVRVWGPWGRKLPAGSPIREVLTDGFFEPAEMVRAFAGAKVVLNLHTWFGQWPYGVNPRLFEAAGAGCCQVVDVKAEIPDLYEVPGEVACFHSFEECERLVAAHLASDAGRRAMGTRAAERTRREHTYDHRVRALIAIAGGGRDESRGARKHEK